MQIDANRPDCAMDVGRATFHSRLAVAAIFSINGIVLASWVPHIPGVKESHGINDAQLGGVLLCMAAGAVVSLSVVGWLVTRFGSRRMTSIASIGLCAALPLPVLVPNVPLLAVSLLILGAFNGALDVSMNSQAVEVERRYGHAIMSSFHGLFSLGGLLGAGAAGLITWLGVSPVAHVLGSAAAALAVVAYALQFLVPTRPGVGTRTPLFVRPTGVLRSLGLLAFAALMAEGAMADWSAVYLHDSLGSSMHVAAVGFAAFSLTMSAGRLTGDIVVRRFGAHSVMRTSGSIAAAGLGFALLIGTPMAAIVGCGAVGLGIANVFPILLSQAGHLRGVESGLALAAVTATGYFGFLAGPPLIGLAGELTTLPFALGIVVAFCAMIALVPVGTEAFNTRLEMTPSADQGRAVRIDA
jgi:MFS family permease